MLTFVFGWLLGFETLAFAFDIRRKFTSAQERERLAQQAFERSGAGQ